MILPAHPCTVVDMGIALLLFVLCAQAMADDWPLHGRTWSEERFSPLTQINHENVSTLGLAWLFDMNTVRGLEATPIVQNGVLFTTGTWSVVYAIDAKTGNCCGSMIPKCREAGPGKVVAMW